MSEDQKPNIPYWHLWTDSEGVSHQTRCALTDFQMKAMGQGTDPQWQGRRTSGEMTVMVTVQPVGWVGQWHENPAAQWIIPLSGRWFVESMDGTRIEMGPGQISFGEDQNTRETDGRRGHRSGTVGDEPAVLMVVQLADEPTIGQACRFS
nr:cupin domain-containing protein [uncultured Lichenicoccus sp.]